MATEETSKKQTQPSADTEKKEQKQVTVFRNLSLAEIVSVCEQKGIDPKKAKFTVRM